MEPCSTLCPTVATCQLPLVSRCEIGLGDLPGKEGQAWPKEVVTLETREGPSARVWAYGKELQEHSAPGSNVWAAFQRQQLMLEHQKEEPAQQRKATRERGKGGGKRSPQSHGCQFYELSRGCGQSLGPGTISSGYAGPKAPKAKTTEHSSVLSFDYLLLSSRDIHIVTSI